MWVKHWKQYSGGNQIAIPKCIRWRGYTPSVYTMLFVNYMSIKKQKANKQCLTPGSQQTPTLCLLPHPSLSPSSAPFSASSPCLLSLLITSPLPLPPPPTRCGLWVKAEDSLHAPTVPAPLLHRPFPLARILPHPNLRLTSFIPCVLCARHSVCMA